MKILLVEDEVRLAQALMHILRKAGYDVDTVADGQSGLDWALSGIYDIIILDVMLPKRDGFSVVAELRRAGIATPVLILTAKDKVKDKIVGLDSGADDYMTKPFSSAELLAHLRALGRRVGDVQFEELAFADLKLNLQSFDLTCVRSEEEANAEGAVDGEEIESVEETKTALQRAVPSKSIHLSYREFNLLRVLMANPGITVSKRTLMERVWGFEAATGDNNVETYVSFLRKKLRFLGSRVQIETLRMAGYRLIDAGKAEAADA